VCFFDHSFVSSLLVCVVESDGHGYTSSGYGEYILVVQICRYLQFRDGRTYLMTCKGHTIAWSLYDRFNWPSCTRCDPTWIHIQPVHVVVNNSSTCDDVVNWWLLYSCLYYCFGSVSIKPTKNERLKHLENGQCMAVLFVAWHYWTFAREHCQSYTDCCVGGKNHIAFESMFNDIHADLVVFAGKAIWSRQSAVENCRPSPDFTQGRPKKCVDAALTG